MEIWHNKNLLLKKLMDRKKKKREEDATRYKSNIQVSQQDSTSDNTNLPIFKTVFEGISVRTGLIMFWYAILRFRV